MALFANMTMARWIALLSLVLSAGLGGVGYWLHGERTRLEDELTSRIPKAAFDIQAAARRHTQLYQEFQREGLKGQSNPDEYIRVLARDVKVQLGGVEIKAAAPGSPAKDVVDRKYTIQPQDAKAGHKRDRLANYMWLLEQQSRRVRVTHVRLDPLEKHQPWEIGSDVWSWEIEVTSRQKL
jgi:hypothetical protein